MTQTQQLLSSQNNHVAIDVILTQHFHLCFQLAPMSTTSDIATAVSYSFSKESLIFRIVAHNGLMRGADIQWLSAFPGEKEFLYPPLTYLQPTGKRQVVELHGIRFTILEVVPTLA